MKKSHRTTISDKPLNLLQMDIPQVIRPENLYPANAGTSLYARGSDAPFHYTKYLQKQPLIADIIMANNHKVEKRAGV